MLVPPMLPPLPPLTPNIGVPALVNGASLNVSATTCPLKLPPLPAVPVARPITSGLPPPDPPLPEICPSAEPLLLCAEALAIAFPPFAPFPGAPSSLHGAPPPPPLPALAFAIDKTSPGSSGCVFAAFALAPPPTPPLALQPPDPPLPPPAIAELKRWAPLASALANPPAPPFCPGLPSAPFSPVTTTQLL